MEILKICCDASVRYIYDRCFTCSGAISINTGQTKYEILPDSTNNRGELWGVYLGCRLALEEKNMFPGRFERINIYSDSQFVIYGLTRWIHAWIKSLDRSPNGIFLSSTGKPVANQNMFLMIITFCWINRLEMHFYNQKGHVNIHDRESLADANDQFYTANKHYLSPKELIELSNYNNYIDETTRDILRRVDPKRYPVVYHNPEAIELCHYILPPDFRQYVRKGSED